MYNGSVIDDAVNNNGITERLRKNLRHKKKTPLERLSIEETYLSVGNEATC